MRTACFIPLRHHTPFHPQSSRYMNCFVNFTGCQIDAITVARLTAGENKLIL